MSENTNNCPVAPGSNCMFLLGEIHATVTGQKKILADIGSKLDAASTLVYKHEHEVSDHEARIKRIERVAGRVVMAAIAVGAGSVGVKEVLTFVYQTFMGGE